MDIPLFEKLRRLTEAVAVADPQKQLKAYYKKVINTKLKLSTWPSAREENEYKFWLLQDGTVIPVEHSHAKTIRNVNIEDDYGELEGRKFANTGAVVGYFSLVANEMGVVSGKTLTSKQIAVLKNLYIEHKVAILYLDVPGRDFSSRIKSPAHLEYLLTYGKDVDEAEVAVADPQKVMKDYCKGKSTKLELSTWHSVIEADWYKFWILTDGTLIPVEHSHLDTAMDAGLHSGRPLLDAGVVRGHIENSTKELDIDSTKKLTSKQISALKNLAIEYKVTSIVADIGSKYYKSPVESSKHLGYLLAYGPMDEAKSEEYQKEQFFVDRTNKHIQLVQDAAAKIVEDYPELDELLKQVEVHDASKLEEPERTPYVEITWRHKLENEKGEYDPYNGKGYQTPGKLEKEDENEATLHHITTNSHHPEYHLATKHKEANVDTDDRDESELVDASLMPEIDVAEMIADWQAMAIELETNTAREWFEKQRNVRWSFSKHQEELIDKLLKVFEEK